MSTKGAASSGGATRYEAGVLPRLGQVWVELNARGEWVKLMLPDLDDRQPSTPAGALPLSPEVKRALTRYVEGDPAAFEEVVVAPASSPFSAAVRKAMCLVPRGKVATYGELARSIGKPGAARAVGRACATNPVPVVVPCHRVVASGGPGGFGLGLQAKRALLAIEGLELGPYAPT